MRFLIVALLCALSYAQTEGIYEAANLSQEVGVAGSKIHPVKSSVISVKKKVGSSKKLDKLEKTRKDLSALIIDSKSKLDEKHKVKSHKSLVETETSKSNDLSLKNPNLQKKSEDSAKHRKGSSKVVAQSVNVKGEKKTGNGKMEPSGVWTGDSAANTKNQNEKKAEKGDTTIAVTSAKHVDMQKDGAKKASDEKPQPSGVWAGKIPDAKQISKTVKKAPQNEPLADKESEKQTAKALTVKNIGGAKDEKKMASGRAPSKAEKSSTNLKRSEEKKKSGAGVSVTHSLGVKGEKETSKANAVAVQVPAAKLATSAHQQQDPPSPAAAKPKVNSHQKQDPPAALPGVEGEKKAGLFGFGKKKKKKSGGGKISEEGQACCKQHPEWCKDEANPPKDEYERKGRCLEKKGATYEGDVDGESSSRHKRKNEPKKKKKSSWWGSTDTESAASDLANGKKHNQVKDPPSKKQDPPKQVKPVPVLENIPLPQQTVANLVKKKRKNQDANQKQDDNQDNSQSSFLHFVKDSPYPVTTVGVAFGVLVTFSCVYYAFCDHKEGDSYVALLDSTDASLP